MSETVVKQRQVEGLESDLININFDLSQKINKSGDSFTGRVEVVEIEFPDGSVQTTALTSSSGGETITASNVGVGAKVFKAKEGSDLKFKTLTSGSSITITDTPDTIQITSSAENNTGASLGAGNAVFSGKVGTQLQFKSLVAGANTTITSNSNEITISAGTTNILGNGASIDRPYENFVAIGGTDGWPDRTTPENSLFRIGLGASGAHRAVTAGDAPSGIFMQNYVKPDFTGDPNAYYVGGANLDTIVSGGIGGTTGFASTVYKITGTYTGDAGIIGGRIGADARAATNYSGIITGFWAFTHGDKNATGGIAPGIEINAFNNQIWNTTTNYTTDPFITNNKRSVIGLLINNYQSAVSEFGGTAGQYQNSFGIALTSLGPGGVGGRAFGYQTGLYITEHSKEAIRIRGGVYGSAAHFSDYGIKFEGTAHTVAAIAIANNKINWGEYLGSSWNNGDMWANAGALYFRRSATNREVLTANGAGTSGSYAGDRKIPVIVNGTTYYLIASTTA